MAEWLSECIELLFYDYQLDSRGFSSECLLSRSLNFALNRNASTKPLCDYSPTINHSLPSSDPGPKRRWFTRVHHIGPEGCSHLSNVARLRWS